MKKKIKFIINPLSGGKNKDNIPALIAKVIDTRFVEFDIAITRNEAHTLEIASLAVNEKYDAIVAVGGDGTLNNIARFLTGKDIALGIVPMGSGNGFARELKIPMMSSKALIVINNFKLKKTDTGTVNNRIFMNVCGVGFDAHITGLFAKSLTRGLITYAKLTLKEMRTYKAQTYQLIIDGKEVKQKAFMLVVCNGTQFGNNAFIAPGAKFDDGLFNITVIEDFKWFQILSVSAHLFFNKIDKWKNVKTYTGKNIIIKRPVDGYVNIDGEPVMMGSELHINMKPLTLNLIVP